MSVLPSLSSETETSSRWSFLSVRRFPFRVLRDDLIALIVFRINGEMVSSDDIHLQSV